MKKFATLFTVLLLVITSPVFATGSNTTPPSAKEISEAQILLHRIGEIQAMDKSNLDPVAKSELREEMKVIHKQLKTLESGGVYVSVGAIIIILLLLIILL